MSYRNLEIWQLAKAIVVEIYDLTLQKLPKFEMYEEGSQIRRSIKSVKSNIVEGYGRRRYKQEFLRFLIYAQASNDETIDHLETLYQTGSFADKVQYEKIYNDLTVLGKKINLFIQAVMEKHASEK